MSERCGIRKAHEGSQGFGTSVLLGTTRGGTTRTMHRNRLSCVVIAILVTLLMVVLTGMGATSAQTSPALGVYAGPANVAGNDEFGSWLGNDVTYATDFLDKTKTWYWDVANPTWLLDPWSSWVNAAPGRRLSLGVPMLIEESRGQLAQGARGDFDSYFRTLAQNMVSRGLGTSVLRLGWEMNTSEQPWWAGTDPASFSRYWARIVRTMRAVPGARFSFDWTAGAGVQGGSTLTSFSQFYPGDAYVDIIGLDNYDIKWEDSTSTPEERWNFHLTRPLGLNDHKAFAVAHGKPMSFPEWGLYASVDQQGGGGDNPYYIGRMADWFTSGSVTYQSYFNADWGGGTLDSFPMAKNEYKLRFGTTLPSLTR